MAEKLTGLLMKSFAEASTNDGKTTRSLTQSANQNIRSNFTDSNFAKAAARKQVSAQASAARSLRSTEDQLKPPPTVSFDFKTPNKDSTTTSLKTPFSSLTKSDASVASTPNLHSKSVEYPTAMVRLLPGDLPHLYTGEEITIVIRPSRRGESPELKARRARVFNAFTRIIRDNHSSSTPVDDEELLKYHAFHRSGKEVYYQFPAKVKSYPNRFEIVNNHHGVDKMIDMWWKAPHNGGIGISIDGYQTLIPFDLRWNEMDAVEIWGLPRPDVPNSFVKFEDRSREFENLADELGKLLHMVEGDVTRTTEAVKEFYREKSNRLTMKLMTANKKADTQKSIPKEAAVNENDFESFIDNELNYSTIQEFCVDCDIRIKNRFEEHYNHFHPIGEGLISDELWSQMFSEFEVKFPFLLTVLKAIAYSRRDAKDDEDDDTNQSKKLLEKKKFMLNQFFSMCRARHSNLLVHWGMVNTLAGIGKGLPHMTSRGLYTKAFSSTLKTTMDKLADIYSRGKCQLASLLESQFSISYCLDNYQMVHAKLLQDDKKSAITHNGTAFTGMRNKWYLLPIGTLLVSPDSDEVSIRSSNNNLRSALLSVDITWTKS